jgi:hypothetical protein
MYCTHCGNTLPPDYNHCPQCGTPLRAFAGVPGPSRLQRHLRTLSTLWIVVGGLWLVPSLGLMTLSHTIHLVVHDRDVMGQVFGPPILFGLGAVFLIVAAGGVCIGLGLLQYASSARMAALAFGVVALLHPPLGTALGIYTLWVLLPSEAAMEYDRAGTMG